MRPLPSVFWLGILWLVVAAVLLGLYAQHFAQGVRVEGTVVGMETRPSGRRSRTYHAVVAYPTGNRTRTVTGSVSISPNPYRRGDKVTVLYLPNAPQSAVIHDFFQVYLLPLVSGAIGGVCVTAGLVGAYSTTRAVRTPPAFPSDPCAARAA